MAIIIASVMVVVVMVVGVVVVAITTASAKPGCHRWCRYWCRCWCRRNVDIEQRTQLCPLCGSSLETKHVLKFGVAWGAKHVLAISILF